MKNIIIGAIEVLAIVLLTCVSASAQGGRFTSRDAAGALLTAGGAVVAVMAFSYGHCPDGYSKHTYSYGEYGGTDCFYYNRYTGDTDSRGGHARLERKEMLYGGLAATGAGLLLWLLPENHGVSASATPDGWRASKSFSW